MALFVLISMSSLSFFTDIPVVVLVGLDFLGVLDDSFLSEYIVYATVSLGNVLGFEPLTFRT